MPITSFCLSVFCRMRGLSHTLGKRFSKAELSADVHHPLNEGISSDVNSIGISHLFSQLISDGEHFFWHYYYFTYFAYAHYYFLLFVFVLQDTWTVSYSWQDVQLSVDVPHPLAYDVSSDINYPGISHLFSQLIYNGEHLDLAHIFYAHYRPLLSSLCLPFAECADCLILLARCSAKPSSLFMFITF